MYKRLQMCKVLLLVMLVMSGQAVALPGPDEQRQSGGIAVISDQSPAYFSQARDGVSLDQAAAMVRRQTGGRIIKASSRSSNGRTVHFIRVLTPDGKVFTVRVDARTGRVL